MIMKKYIDKDALAAEIDDMLNTKERTSHCDEDSFNSGRWKALKKIKDMLDTLEVKEVDLENSMVCKVGWYDGFLLDYTQEQQDALLGKIGANVGDKIRVILIKE